VFNTKRRYAFHRVSIFLFLFNVKLPIHVADRVAMPFQEQPLRIKNRKLCACSEAKPAVTVDAYFDDFSLG
jgi:hypothetical protein